MKPSFIALFFLFAFIASSAKAQFVLDTQGKPLTNGGSYYIVSYIWPGGGLSLAKTGNETCPLSVKRVGGIISDYGLPWKIAHSGSGIRYILDNAFVDFFSVEGKVPSCVNSNSQWTIVEGEDGTMSVKISGSYENTIKGVFRIRYLGLLSHAYKIVFCRTDVEDFSCKDVGLADDFALVLTDENPFGILFFNAESTEVSKQRINNVLEA